jgi:hypothetical protein
MGFDKLIFSLTDSIAFQVSKKQDSICKIFLQAYSFDMLMLGIGMTHPMPSAYQRWPSEFNSPGIFSCSRVRPSLHLIALTNPYSLHTVRCPNHVKVIESHGYIRSDVRTRVGIWPSRGTNYNTLVQTALLFLRVHRLFFIHVIFVWNPESQINCHASRSRGLLL